MTTDTDQTEAEAKLESAPPKKKAGKIFLTLLTLILTGATAVFAYLKDSSSIQDLLAKDPWTTQLIGNLHPILMLLPLGLILAVMLPELCGWLSFGKWKPKTKWTLFLVVLTGSLAAISGLVLMKLEGNTGPDWSQYLWYGIGATLAFGIAYIVKIWSDQRGFSEVIYALFVIGGTAAVSYGAYTYGQKVHAYTVAPEVGNLQSPFGNKLAKERLASEVTDLRASSEKLQNAMQDGEQKVATVTASLTQAQIGLQAEQKKNAMAKQETMELREKLREGEQKVGQAQKRLSEAQAKAAQLEKKVANLSTQLETTQKKVSTTEKALQEAKAAAAEVKKEVTPTPVEPEPTEPEPTEPEPAE